MKYSLVLAASLVITNGIASAQHVDVMVQLVDGQLTTGVANVDGGSFTLPHRVFTGNLLSNFRTSSPGFFSLPSGSVLMPNGAGALPATSPLEFTLLPMTIDGVQSNLWYWDGLAEVDWQHPVGQRFVVNSGSGLAIASGSPDLVAGGVLGTTSSDGSLHQHPLYRLERINGGDPPPQGVYLLSFELAMEGTAPTDPFYIAWRTASISAAQLDIAAQWVAANIDTISLPPSDTLAGDYNDDGLVDAADYTMWRDTLGSTTALAADGDSDQIVTAGDYHIWRDNFGPNSVLVGAPSNVPEPDSLLLLAVLFFASRGVPAPGPTLRPCGKK